MQRCICGKEGGPAGDEWRNVINPATGEAISRIRQGTAGDVNAAAEKAAGSFRAWSQKTGRERGLILFHAAGLIRDQHKELGRLLTLEQGKPLREAIDEVRGFCNILEFYAGLSSHPSGETTRLGTQGDCMVVNEPLGVCGAVVPWNMPVIILGWKVGPALLAGNTLIVKPSSTAPLTVMRIASVMEDAGLPPGVLNVVTGSGSIVGEAILAHPDVRKISFTGSCSTGQHVRELASAHSKELLLELGGSDPMIVMDDADLAKAVEGALRGRFYNAGQTCTAVKRLYLHEKIAGSFIADLRSRVESLHIGNGLYPKTEIGPLNNEEQRDAISGIIDQVRNESEGNIITGGNRPVGEQFDHGFFFEPTLVTDVPSGSVLMSGEIFGPVLPIMTFPDLETAISEANRSSFGLGASVWTNDIRTIRRVFNEVEAGVIWVNRHLSLPPEIPFGGTKGSGIGRENGYRAMDHYTKTKALFIGP